MSINIQPRPPQPDDSSIEFDANGLLAVKAAGVPASALADATEGDILLCQSDGSWSVLNIGSGGTYLKSDGTTASWAAVSAGGMWNYIATLSPSGVGTITSGTLTAYEEYMVRGRVISASGTPDILRIRLNGDTGSNYNYRHINATSILTGTTTNFIITRMSATADAYFILQIEGITPAVGSGALGINQLPGYVGDYQGLTGNWVGGNATQITTMTFLSLGADTFNGEIEIFGRNRT